MALPVKGFGHIRTAAEAIHLRFAMCEHCGIGFLKGDVIFRVVQGMGHAVWHEQCLRKAGDEFIDSQPEVIKYNTIRNRLREGEPIFQ